MLALPASALVRSECSAYVTAGAASMRPHAAVTAAYCGARCNPHGLACLALIEQF